MEAAVWGGNAAAIHHHYDVGNDFWEAWLDPTMSYSCALWDQRVDKNDLRVAQLNKHRWHLERAGMLDGGRLLDIGSGWGALLRTYHNIVGHNRLSAVGLTLSREQKRYCDALQLPNTTFLEQSWADHQPDTPYDGIVTMGAFEHFAKVHASHAEKLHTYRTFFSRCRDWLERGGLLTVQTVAYGSMRPEEQNAFIANEIFPDAELPKPCEMFEASEEFFEVSEYRNDRMDYARTCELWLRNMKANKQRIIELAGEDVYRRYEKYIMLSLTGFLQGKIVLVRMQLRAL